MRRYARIIGTGSYLPPRRLTNNDLAAELAQRGLETSDEWIVERTGIRARHFAEPDVTSSDLALEASRNAIEAAGIEASDIDLIIVATSTPDMVFPSTPPSCSTSWASATVAQPLMCRRCAAVSSMPWRWPIP